MKVLGTTDEVTTCELCGRADLKFTVALESSGGIVHYGRDCAARATGWTESEVSKAVTAAKNEAHRQAMADTRRRWREESARPDSWESFCSRFGGIGEAIERFGSFAAAREAWIEWKKEAA